MLVFRWLPTRDQVFGSIKATPAIACNFRIHIHLLTKNLKFFFSLHRKTLGEKQYVATQRLVVSPMDAQVYASVQTHWDREWIRRVSRERHYYRDVVAFV